MRESYEMTRESQGSDERGRGDHRPNERTPFEKTRPREENLEVVMTAYDECRHSKSRLKESRRRIASFNAYCEPLRVLFS